MLMPKARSRKQRVLTFFITSVNVRKRRLWFKVRAYAVCCVYSAAWPTVRTKRRERWHRDARSWMRRRWLEASWKDEAVADSRASLVSAVDDLCWRVASSSWRSLRSVCSHERSLTIVTMLEARTPVFRS